MLLRLIRLKQRDDGLLSKHCSHDLANAWAVGQPALRAEAEDQLRDVNVRMIFTATKIVDTVVFVGFQACLDVFYRVEQSVCHECVISRSAYSRKMDAPGILSRRDFLTTLILAWPCFQSVKRTASNQSVSAQIQRAEVRMQKHVL